MTLTVEQKVADLVAQLQNVKQDFVTFIQDTSIPLDRRWELFMLAPTALKSEEYWIQHIKEIERVDEDAIAYDGWLYYTERHQTVYIADSVNEWSEYTEDDIKASFYVEEHRKKFKEIDWNKVKEELLAKNLWSYHHDW